MGGGGEYSRLGVRKPEEDSVVDISIDGRLSTCLFLEGVVKLHPAHVRDKWRTLVKTVMNLRVIYNKGHFLTS